MLRRLRAFLERLTPPQSIRGNAKAQSNEIQSMLNVIVMVAPRGADDEWWRRFEQSVLENMKTRAWPIVSEVRKAATAATREVDTGGDERKKLDQVEAWVGMFGAPHPSFNSPYYTDHLLRQGMLRSERHALFKGFLMDREKFLIAKGQPMSGEEKECHLRVMSQLAEHRERHRFFERRDKERGRMPTEADHAEDLAAFARFWASGPADDFRAAEIANLRRCDGGMR